MTRLAETFGPYQRRIFFHTLLCLLSSILLLLIFPKFDLRFLAPFALAPLLFVMAKTRTDGSDLLMAGPPVSSTGFFSVRGFSSCWRYTEAWGDGVDGAPFFSSAF